MAAKTKLRPRHNERKRQSFERRYGMTRQEWAELKKKLRAEGNGKQIAYLQTKALVKNVVSKLGNR